MRTTVHCHVRDFFETRENCENREFRPTLLEPIGLLVDQLAAGKDGGVGARAKARRALSHGGGPCAVPQKAMPGCHSTEG